jgi:hypothetical protein
MDIELKINNTQNASIDDIKITELNAIVPIMNFSIKEPSSAS